MRDYLTEVNFGKALMLAALTTAISAPRILCAGMPLGFYVPAAFFSMMLVSGAATAWSRKGGMCGLMPEWNRIVIGSGIALFFAVLAAPVVYYKVDPMLRAMLERGGDRILMETVFPSTVGGKYALVLWSAGFETMFFCAGAMSLFARLTGRQWTALTLAVSLRLFVSMLRLAEAGAGEGTGLLLAGTAVTSTMCCVLFAKTGLIPAMLLAAGLNIHLFLLR